MSGRKVRKILLERGVVLSDLADMLNISAQTLNNRLNTKSFKDEYVLEIEKLLNISLTLVSKPYGVDPLEQLIANNAILSESIKELAYTNAKLSNRIIELTEREKTNLRVAEDVECADVKASSDE